MHTKRVSGPYPLSCITCRERRKKCDRTHPVCNRCRTGGFTCLGYESRGYQLDGLSGATLAFEQPIPQLSTQGAIPPISNHDALGLTPAPVRLSGRLRLLENYTRSSAAHGQLPRSNAPRSSLAPSAPAQTTPSGQPLRNLEFTAVVDEQSAPAAYTTKYLGSTPPEVRLSPSRTRNLHGDPGSNSGRARETTSSKNRLHDLATLRFSKRQQEPIIYPDPDSSVIIVEFITSQYERVFHMMIFELVSHQPNFVRDGFLEGITASKSSCWSLYLGAQIYHTLIESNSRASVKPYAKQIDWVEQRLTLVPPGASTTRELDGWLAAALEMLYVRLVTEPHLAYRVLCNTKPIFLQMTYADSTLWPESGNVGVSLHNVLLSLNHRIARFAILDITMSLLFGTPLLIEWDASFPPVPSRQVVEWLPGCPPQFAIALAKISLWRDRDAYTQGVNCWREIEEAIRGWSAPYVAGNPSFGSFGAIGRLAIQEALRHATLIYLYMGMCGLASGDSRVQESCRQIAQLSGLAAAEPAISLHLFLPMVVAGVCASNESHREIVHNVLSHARSYKVFLFQQTDFTGVLDHLWHGAAKNGADIFWDDYLASCRAVIKMRGGVVSPDET